jgi:hypothetical protein
MIDVLVRLQTAQRALQAAYDVARRERAPREIVGKLSGLLYRVNNLLRMARELEDAPVAGQDHLTDS